MEINSCKYFVNLSSFKPKHISMKESVDFIKIGNYAVINLNNMLPVPDGEYNYVDFSKEADANYRNLLRNEYRIISKKSDRIIKNAKVIYNHKLKNGNDTPLARRCCDFLKLEEFAKNYSARTV